MFFSRASYSLYETPIAKIFIWLAAERVFWQRICNYKEWALILGSREPATFFSYGTCQSKSPSFGRLCGILYSVDGQ